MPISQQSPNGQPADQATFLTNLSRSNYLLGDLFGLRTSLSKYGITLVAQETSEVLGNPTGGTQKGAHYDGLTQLVMQLNTQRAFGLYGGVFNVSALQIHGQNFSANNLSTIQTASGIEADRGARLWELWYDQKFLDEDHLDIKLGQQSVDQQFMVSTNAAYFVSRIFGWPALPSYDMPSGGPAYPLSSVGIRLRYRPVNSISLLLGVFNGSPASSSDGAPLRRKHENDALALSNNHANGNPAIPENAHVRLGAPENNDGAQMLRRSYSYDNGLSYIAERWPPWHQGMAFDAGLLFISYQRDPRTGFVKIFDKMAKFDMMNQFVTHVGGGLFACPPGAKEGGFIGQPLFDLA